MANPATVELANWSLPAGIRACITDRHGGISKAPYESFNLALHVDDDSRLVQANREQLCNRFAGLEQVHWLQQVHGHDVHHIDQADATHVPNIVADAAVTSMVGQACCVLTADCLPVLFCRSDGQQVAAAHAGWRGLAGGVLQQTLDWFPEPSEVLVYIGPAIGPRQFEVGADVVRAFQTSLGDECIPFFQSRSRFNVGNVQPKWLANLAGLAEALLQQAGVSNITHSATCTVEDDRYFSYRRDGQTGRFASLIWREK